MPRPTSFRLAEGLLERLEQQAGREERSTTALVISLLDEGLKTRQFSGIVYRDGPVGRRAGLVGGPDIWEVVRAVQEAAGAGEQRIDEVAEQTDLAVEQVRLAIDFYAAYPTEIDGRIEADERAAGEVQQLVERRERLLSS